jgi:hypothetical protein
MHDTYEIEYELYKVTAKIIFYFVHRLMLIFGVAGYTKIARVLPGCRGCPMDSWEAWPLPHHEAMNPALL